ncbi:nuclear transport factor 2 family protein [Blastococcus sp. SYSU D00820]
MTDTGAVVRTLYEFAQGIDTRDWALLESVFTAEFDYDYTSHRPGSGGRTTAVDWVAARRRRFETMQATQHSMTNPRVVVDGDVARCRMYVEAWHVAEVGGAADWCTIGGEYHDVLQRHGDRWLISELRLERRWTVGNPAVLDLPTG